jgi:hypothetical protein
MAEVKKRPRFHFTEGKNHPHSCHGRYRLGMAFYKQTEHGITPVRIPGWKEKNGEGFGRIHL